MPERVIYVVRSWPRLSQTFVVEEIRALERRGTALAVVSLVHSGETTVQPQVRQVRAPVTHLDDPAPLRVRLREHRDVARRAPRRYLHALLTCLRHPELAAGYGDCSALGCFGHAVRVAALVHRLRDAGEPVSHLHAHFAHDPALVGMLAAELAGLRFTFTAHARDLLQIPAAALTARTRAASALVTCCEANAEHVTRTVAAEHLPPVHVVRHGVDLTRFQAPARRPAHPAPALVSVGRLVEKKGFDDLLLALQGLRGRGGRFTCRVYGEGPLRRELTEQRDRLGLADAVTFEGEVDADEVRRALAAADVFVLLPRVTDDGDRDGIPNVLVEAMACSLPVVATDAGGVAELVHDGDNGVLLPERDVPGATAALARLAADPALRARLGRNARATVEAGFDVDLAASRLQRLFEGTSRPVAGVAR